MTKFKVSKIICNKKYISKDKIEKKIMSRIAEMQMLNVNKGISELYWVINQIDNMNAVSTKIKQS